MSNPPAPSPAKSSGEAGAWQSVVDQIDPAWLLVVIHGRMSQDLSREFAPEDVLQEVMVSAWTSRKAAPLDSPQALRSWILSIVAHRLCDISDRINALKRGGKGIGRQPADMADMADMAEREAVWLRSWRRVEAPDAVMVSTTPSRIASHRERADMMLAALTELEPEQREVLRLRLFEQQPLGRIAQQLGIGEGAVRHRLRVGSQAYAMLLQRCGAAGSRALRVSPS